MGRVLKSRLNSRQSKPQLLPSLAGGAQHWSLVDEKKTQQAGCCPVMPLLTNKPLQQSLLLQPRCSVLRYRRRGLEKMRREGRQGCGSGSCTLRSCCAPAVEPLRQDTTASTA